LSARGLAPLLSADVAVLEKKIRSIRHQWSVRGSQAYPLVIPEEEQDGPYLTMESLFPTSNDSGPLIWITAASSVLAFIRDHTKCRQLDDPFFERIGVEYNTGRGTVNRLNKLRNGGNFDYRTVAYCETTIARGSSHSPEYVYILRANVTSSQRKRTQCVYLVFSKARGMEFLGCPVSRCSCEVGRWMCAHMMTFLLYILNTQTFLSEIGTVENLKKILPTPITLAKEELIAPSFICTKQPHRYS
jgi:hypothetical protein